MNKHENQVSNECCSTGVNYEVWCNQLKEEKEMFKSQCRCYEEQMKCKDNTIRELKDVIKVISKAI